MTDKKPTARPKALTPKVKRLIAQTAVSNPTYDRTLLARQLIADIEKAGEVAPTEDTCIKYISDARSKYTIDNPWNTATLNIEPISPDTIPWLITAQLRMKEYYSKPLTIREAKWYNRLLGFQHYIKASEDIESDIEIKRYFVCNVITEWSHIYAYREKIDDIAEIKQPNYSDFDYYLATLDYKAIYDYGDKFTVDNMVSFTNKPDSITKDSLIRWANKIFRPSFFELLRFIESRYLGHSLGEPDFDTSDLYHRILALIGSENALYFDKISKLSYTERIDFFKSLREVCKDTPEEVKNANLNELLSMALREDA